MYESYKQQVYKKWIENGRPWFSVDGKGDPTHAERQIILEMLKQEAGIQQKRRPKNEVREFDSFINNK